MKLRALLLMTSMFVLVGADDCFLLPRTTECERDTDCDDDEDCNGGECERISSNDEGEGDDDEGDAEGEGSQGASCVIASDSSQCATDCAYPGDGGGCGQALNDAAACEFDQCGGSQFCATGGNSDNEYCGCLEGISCTACLDEAEAYVACWNACSESCQ